MRTFIWLIVLLMICKHVERKEEERSAKNETKRNEEKVSQKVLKTGHKHAFSIALTFDWIWWNATEISTTNNWLSLTSLLIFVPLHLFFFFVEFFAVRFINCSRPLSDNFIYVCLPMVESSLTARFVSVNFWTSPKKNLTIDITIPPDERPCRMI